MDKECTHTASIRQVTPSALGCEECLKMGSVWVHLRLCRTCVRPISICYGATIPLATELAVQGPGCSPSAPGRRRAPERTGRVLAACVSGPTA